MVVIQPSNTDFFHEVIFLKTTGFDNQIWESYCKIFNQVFDKSFEKSYFIQKYQTTVLGYSFHGLLFDEFHQVKGGVTIIPYIYLVNKEKRLIGLAVDAFIHPEFRSNAFILADMYSLASSEARKANLFGILSVPNSVAYPYWKNFVGWQDIGKLPYYALPLRLEKFMNITSSLRKITNTALSIWGKLTIYFSFTRHRKIKLLKNPSFLEHRLYTWHHVIKDESTIVILRTQHEERIKTTYILGCFDLHMNWSKRAYKKAIHFTICRIRPDIILFIGNLPFHQCTLFKVPHKKIPKVLPLTFDFLKEKNVGGLDYLECKNWDFSLINYDVR